LTCTFLIKCVGRSGKTAFFEAKEKYKLDVNLESGKGVCSCQAGTMKASGKKQEDCKHVKQAKAIIEVMGWTKKERD